VTRLVEIGGQGGWEDGGLRNKAWMAQGPMGKNHFPPLLLPPKTLLEIFNF